MFVVERLICVVLKNTPRNNISREDAPAVIARRWLSSRARMQDATHGHARSVVYSTLYNTPHARRENHRRSVSNGRALYALAFGAITLSAHAHAGPQRVARFVYIVVSSGMRARRGFQH